MVSEDRKQEGLALGLSIADNLTISRLSKLGPFAARVAVAAASGVAALDQSDADQVCVASQQVGALSGGNQQKVAIARLLHADVDVLLLDEPTRGIDVGSKAQIYQCHRRTGGRRPGSRPAAQSGADDQQLPAGTARRVR